MRFSLLIISLALYQIVSAQTAGGWSLVSEEEVDNSPDIQDALKFGVGNVIGQAINAGAFPDSDYDVTEIYLVLRQVVNGLNYRFEVQVVSAEGDIFRVKCDVNVAAAPAGQMQVLRYKYGTEDDGWDDLKPGKFNFLPVAVYESGVSEEELSLEEGAGNEEEWSLEEEAWSLLI